LQPRRWDCWKPRCLHPRRASGSCPDCRPHPAPARLVLERMSQRGRWRCRSQCRRGGWRRCWSECRSGGRRRCWSQCRRGGRHRRWRQCWGSGHTRGSGACPGICPGVTPQGSARYASTERDQDEQGCKRSHENSHKTLLFHLIDRL
jgi:hypothetical protein